MWYFSIAPIPASPRSRRESSSFGSSPCPGRQSRTLFCAHAGEKARKQTAFLAQDEECDGLIYFSCTPWFDFTALTNEHNCDRDDTIPRIAWGKYYEQNGGLWLHMSIEVNHRTIDGYHLGLLKEAIDREIAAL